MKKLEFGRRLGREQLNRATIHSYPIFYGLAGRTHYSFRLEDGPLSLEDKFEEVRQLIIIGKEKGFLLYDEVNDCCRRNSHLTRRPRRALEHLRPPASTWSIPTRATASANAWSAARVRRPSEDGIELDLTPGALDKTNDPVRMYLREMGTVPLLTREGEVAIAKRIERGKLSVIKSISRMPAIVKAVIRMGDALKAGERTVRELVIFNDEEITDDRIEERAQKFLSRSTACARRAWRSRSCARSSNVVLKKDKKKYRRASWKHMRAEIEVSRLIRKIEFTEAVKRRIVEEVKDAVERVPKMQRELDLMKKTLNREVSPGSRSSRKRKARTSSSAARSWPPRSSGRPTSSRRAPRTCATRSK